MASRKEQKEQLRRERQEREASASAAARKRRLIGYGVGGGVTLLAIVVAVALLGGGGGGSSASGDVLPDDGSYPEPRDVASVDAAAKAGGCELKSFPAKSREHVADLGETIEYASKPPTSGNHFQTPAEDQAYDEAPDVKELVHTLEHGRVIIWFKKSLPADQRASLKAYYDDDPYQVVLVPDETGMTYAVAATAWNRDPRPNGTGLLLGCKTFGDDVFTALEAFKDENRSRGPEPVP